MTDFNGACIECGQKVERTHENKVRYYVCRSGHKNLRRDYSGPNVLKVVDGLPVHFVVGAVIKKAGKYLIQNRSSYPLGYDVHAGHLEEGEEPLKTLERELQEETGITTQQSKLIFEGVIYDPCNCNINNHYWYLYEVQTDQEPQINEESLDSKWYSLEEVKKMEPKTQPLKYFLEKGLIK
ncbi:MAG: NUDIX hydrolase [Candidatus Diapherotrites archaeon]|nr:NUDIX hydrolase [Candidatus Diapherotrites archaeon]